MRVAVVGSPWVPVPPPAYGGTEAVLVGLLEGLARAGHHVRFYGHPASTAGVEVDAPLAAEDIGPIGHAASELAHVLASYEAATRWGADVIHDHTLVGALAARRTVTPPVVVTNHGPFDAVTRPVFRRVADRAAVVAISHSQASTAEDVPIAAVVHHGLEVSDWPLGDGAGGYVLFLGRMHPDKGPDRAITIARMAGLPIVLAAKMAEPRERAYFDERVRPLLADDATFVGEADSTRKRELLAGAVALVNPISWPEPFGMVMIEALACGTPVAVTPMGAATEIVEDGRTGYFGVDDHDFALALEAASRLDRSACRASVAQRFSVEAMVGHYLDVYGSVPRGPDRRLSSSPGSASP